MRSDTALVRHWPCKRLYVDKVCRSRAEVRSYEVTSPRPNVWYDLWQQQIKITSNAMYLIRSQWVI